MSSGFRLSTDGITWTEVPAEPFLEFLWNESDRRRSDQSFEDTGNPQMYWRFHDRPISGSDMQWFRDYTENPSAQVYVRTKNGQVDVNGDPVFQTYLAEMGWPTGKIDSIVGRTYDEQSFVDVEIHFWNMEEWP